ncbi:MAG: DUF4389 domain-containing protein [Wenzhouxiangella sp.]|jgi:hypothetical protein|nr:DUF4389 domain-containing protein [Wenzhouxiangella sp.]
MSDESQDHLKNSATWIRGLSYLLFFALLTVVSPIAILVSLYGWIMLLWTGRTPEPVINFGSTLADWYRSTLRYITANSMRRPFPFEDLDLPRDEPAPATRHEPEPAKKPARRSEAPKPSASVSPPKPASAGEEKSSPAADAGQRDDQASPAEAGPGKTVEPSTSATTTKKASKKASRKVSRKTSGKTAGKVGKKAGKKASKKVGKKVGKKSAKKAAGKTVEDAAAPSGVKNTGPEPQPSGDDSTPPKNPDAG